MITCRGCGSQYDESHQAEHEAKCFWLNHPEVEPAEDDR